MPFKTLQRVFGDEVEPDWFQIQSFVFVHTVLLRVDVECFLDSPLQTVTLAIDHFHIVEIKGMLFDDHMLRSSRHFKSYIFDAPLLSVAADPRPQHLKIAQTPPSSVV